MNHRLSNKKTFYIIVFGKVHGVGFRYFVREKALDLKLTGWIRNRPNQSVEMEIHGEESLLGIFIDFLRLGNRYSRIDKLEHSTISKSRSYRSFEIHY